MTREGVVTGTPAYLSPEQASGENIDHRSDIYGLGLVLYELLTGHLPFEADSPIDTMLRRLQEPPAPPSLLNPCITPQAEAIILRALARNPAARHPTMEALVNDVSQVAVIPEQAAAVASTTTRLGTLSPAAGPRLVVMGTGATLRLPQQGEALIGRGGPHAQPQPDVDLGPHGGGQAGVSRRHARLLYCPEGWLLEDLHSTNGTYLNSVRLQSGQPSRVRNGDIIRYGQLTLVFYEE